MIPASPPSSPTSAPGASSNEHAHVLRGPLGPYDTRFVAWAEGEYLLIRARHASDSEHPIPGCTLNDDQARQLLDHLPLSDCFSLKGVFGAVEVLT